MAVLDRVYKELVQYGKIQGTVDTSSYGNNTRIRYIFYEGQEYSCKLYNGDVISITKV